jgi:hypothetical protein
MLASFMLTVMPPASADQTKKAPYTVAGLFVDSCSCKAPCACEIIGLAHGCEGVGALLLDSGSFDKADLSGVKIAYATVPGKWVRLYVEVKMPEQLAAAEAFGRAAFAAFGKIESVRPASVAVSGKGGSYTLTVDGGKVISMKMEPVLGGDKKNPVAISNTQNPFASTFLQGKTVDARFRDGGEEFTLKGSNAYFQDRMKAKGDL